MPLPLVAIKISPIIVKIKTFLAGTGVGQAFKAGGLIGLGKYLVTQAITAIRGFFSPKRIAAWFQAAKDYLWNFNWNISDSQIDTEINQSIQGLKNLAGEEFVKVLRNSLGIVIFRKRLPKSVDELILGQITEALETLADSAVRTGAKIAFLKGYKSVRKWLKDSGIAARILGGELAANWGRRGGVISFARAWEFIGRIIPIPSDAQDLPSLPPGRDSSDEIVIIDGEFVDEEDDDLGAIVPVKITPNREVPEEFTYVYAPESLQEMAASIVLAQHQLMDNRDVGVIIGGNSITEFAYERDPKEISLIFEYCPNPNKPYFKVPSDQKTARPKIVISNVIRERITYANLLAAAGGLEGYMYGRSRMTYQLISPSGNNRGEFTVWADNIETAITRCDAFMNLTSSILKCRNPGGEIEGGNRLESRNNMKAIRRVYPYRVSLIVGADSTPQREGRRRLTSPTAQFIQRKAVFSLRDSDPPPFFNEEVNRLFDLMG